MNDVEQLVRDALADPRRRLSGWMFAQAHRLAVDHEREVDDDPRTRFEFRVDDKTWHQSRVQRANIAERRPNRIGARLR